MLENVSQTLIWRHHLKYTKNKDEKLKNMMKMLLNVIITFDSPTEIRIGKAVDF
jgi:hypothetical protein